MVAVDASAWRAAAASGQQRRHGRRAAQSGTCRAAQVDVAPARKAHKVSMVTLGCPKNTVDGEVMLGHLQQSGFEVTANHEESDAIIVNTCAFVEDAKKESLDALMEASQLRAQKDGKRLIVTGCMAQRYAETLSQCIPEADAIVGFERYDDLPAAIEQALAAPPDIDHGNVNTEGSIVRSTPPSVRVGGADVPFRPEGSRVRLTPAHTAYLRVAEGCSHACTFCAIPGFRGKFRSKPQAAVLQEAAHLVSQGVKELVLIAEDSNQYGTDRKDGTSLAALMAELGKLEGLHWIRILYAYPSYFSEDLIDEIANNPKVCKYIDMPLQHMSNLTLLAMNRPPRKHTEDLLWKLKERIPELALRTTFICGFPGETDAQHEELVSFCKQFGFQRGGAFEYSEEEGTPAASLPDQVQAEVREARRDELISLQQRVGAAFASSQVGKTLEVLVDGEDEDGMMVGRTQWDAPDIDPVVLLSQSEDPAVPSLEAGQLRRVRIDDSITFDLVGTPVDSTVL